MTHIQHIQTELDKACALLNTAADLMSEGRIVSIVSLNGIVNNICSLIKEEGYARCQAFKPLIVRLTDQMDRISLVMKNQLENYDKE